MKKDVYKLTTPQNSIYLSEQFNTAPINNIVGTMFFKKTIDLDILKKAVHLTVQNNQAMRTIIFKKQDTPMQYFNDCSYFKIKTFDFSDKTMKDFRNFQSEFSQKVFNIYGHNLFQFVLCILPNDEVALIGKFHHLIADAWSLGLIIDNIAINYTNLINKSDIPNNLGLYSDFINREKEYLTSDTYKKNKDFWEKAVSDVEPISLKNTLSNSYIAKRLDFEFSENETHLIDNFCKNNHISAYVLFLAVLNLYIYRTTSYDSFSIQTPILNRLGKEKNTIGMFINMISIPLKNSPNLKVSDLLQQLSKDSVSFFKNSKYPYMHLLKNLRKNNIAQNYHVVYSFQNMRPKNQIPNLVNYIAEWNFIGYIQDDFVVNITDINNTGHYHILYDYRVDLFSKEEITWIHKRIRTILFDILKNIDKTISEIEILPKEEKKLLLKNFNNTKFSYDDSKTLIDLFEETVNNFPEKTALIYQDISYTYRELNYMANVVALELSNHHITNSKVAILCKKSAWMVASLLGIMKSGNAYIPVDSEYPEERIRYILQDSKCKMLICSESYKDSYDFKHKIILEDLDFTSNFNYTSLAKRDSLAYMIYTSGTTGNPKGVEIKHKNIINTLIWRKDYYNFDETIIVLQIPSFSFDSSVEDIFTPLISGSTLVIPSVTRMDVNIIAQELVNHKVNHFLVVPSLYKILLQEKLDSLSTLKFVTIAGENFPMQLVKEHFTKLPQVRLVNEYGPTENSVCSTFYELTKEDNVILIGKPIYNNKCYCLNENLDLLPIGCKGELYVSGPGVSDGYFGRADLNRKRFLKNPFDSKFPMYKTGDIAIRHFDGNLEFVGRDDGQVKLHGLRIELKEIEKNILTEAQVSDCIVTIKENSSKKQILVAYITTYKSNFDVSILYEKLKKKLPFYMIPLIVKLKAFPLTPNGKIDKKKLPLPEAKKTVNSLPKNALQNDILTICQEVLMNPNLGIYDDFFTVGNADSLSILTINSKLFSKGITVKTQDFYEFPCVEALFNYITEHKNITQEKHNYMVKPKLTYFPKNLDKKNLFFPYKNVLLTGVTGFLGVHILDYLLKNTDCMIYCIIREKYNQAPQKRLENILGFYFDNHYYETYQNRIIVLNGELSKEFFNLSQEDYSNLQKNTDCIINTAANTRHYGSYSSFERENINTVKNLILFAKPTGIILNHMSTTNVSGNYLVENDISYQFTEEDFYIGQNYEDNVYIHSKFEAEKLILEEEYKGLKANIFRLGNLMARFKDGMFQKNKMDNSYYTRLIALAKIGSLPKYLETQQLEFSPIDEVAEAIIKLLTIPNLENHIFHIFSNELISIDKLLSVFKEYGYPCKFTNYNTFIRNLHLQKNEKILKYIISDLNQDKKFDYHSDIVIDQTITNQFLDLVGFKWSKIDETYLKTFFDKTNFTKDITA